MDTMTATMGLCLICIGIVALFVYGIAQTFWGYKRRVFFRILPGFFAGVLISSTTGFLILMDGTRGDVIRLLVDVTRGRIVEDTIKIIAELIKAAVTDSKAFGQGLYIASGILNAVDATDILDTVRTMVIFGVLFSVVCAVVSAAREKIGVALELFAYGYTPVALYFVMKESTLLGVILAILVGALLGTLGYRISRIWIIITAGFIGGLIVFYSFLSLSSLSGFVDTVADYAFQGYYMWNFIKSLLAALMEGAAWAIAVGSLQRALDHKISRTRIIITIGLHLILFRLTVVRILPIIALIICGIYAQLKTTAASTEKMTAVSADPAQSASGHQVSHMRIIIVAGICVVLTCVPIPSLEGISTEMALYIMGIGILQKIPLMIFLIIVSIYAQRRAMAISTDKTAAQPAAVTADSAAPLKQGAPSPAWPKIARAAKGASTSNGRSFCAKCGKPLEPGVKFCGKCGQPTRSGDDAAKSE